MTNNSNCQISPVLYLIGYSIISLLGLIMNSIAIFLFFWVNKLRSPTVVYMKNLTIADLLLVCTFPLRIYSYAAHPSQINSRVQFLICDITGSFLLLNMYGSIFLLTCISFDRYLAISFPLRSRRFREKASWICLGVWFLSVTSCIVNYTLAKQTNNSSFYGHGQPKDRYCLDGRPQFVTMIGPTIGAIGMGFLIPLAVIVVSSVAMLRSMKQSQVVQEGIVNKVKVIRMLAINIMIFLLCFLPYHMVLLLYQFMDNCFIEKAYKVTLLTACCNTVLDPFAYYFTTSAIRNVVKDKIKVRMKFGELSGQSFEKTKHNISS